VRISPQRRRHLERLVVGALPGVAVVERDAAAVHGPGRRADDDTQFRRTDAIGKRLIREVDE
jgi:hypothetical protein